MTLGEWRMCPNTDSCFFNFKFIGPTFLFDIHSFLAFLIYYPLGTGYTLDRSFLFFHTGIFLFVLFWILWNAVFIILLFYIISPDQIKIYLNLDRFIIYLPESHSAINFFCQAWVTVGPRIGGAVHQWLILNEISYNKTNCEWVSVLFHDSIMSKYCFSRNWEHIVTYVSSYSVINSVTSIFYIHSVQTV